MGLFSKTPSPIVDEDRKTTLRKMTENADTEVGTLQGEQKLLAHRLAEIDAETVREALAIQQRNEHIATLHRRRSEAHTAYTSAEAYCKLAADTPAWRPALDEFKSAETALHQAEQQLATEEGSAQAANEADEQHISELVAERAQVQARHDAIPGKITALRQHKHDLYAELGTILRDEAKGRVAAVEARVNEQARVLAELRAELQQAIQQEAEGLQEWPEHRLELRQQLVVDDAISRVLEALIVLHGALIDDGPTLNIEPSILRQVSPSLASLGELLLLPGREVWAAMAGREGECLTIRERKNQLERLLSAYRESKK